MSIHTSALCEAWVTNLVRDAQPAFPDSAAADAPRSDGATEERNVDATLPQPSQIQGRGAISRLSQEDEEASTNPSTRRLGCAPPPTSPISPGNWSRALSSLTRSGLPQQPPGRPHEPLSPSLLDY